MIDPIPDTSKRIAYALGFILHPFVLFVVGAFFALRGESFIDSLKWIVLVGGMTILPTFAMMLRVRLRGERMYQRTVRGPVYAAALISLVVCTMVLILLDAPNRLTACLIATLVWLPIQFLVNTYYTKISGHAAFSMGVAVGLFMFGELDTPVLQLVAIAVVLLVAWARVTTQHHTLRQVLLGWLVAGVSVGLTFLVILD